MNSSLKFYEHAQIVVCGSVKGSVLGMTTLGGDGTFSGLACKSYEWNIPERFIIHLRLKLRRDKFKESRGSAGEDFPR